MKLVFFLLSLCLVLIDEAAGKKRKDVLADCVKDKLGGYLPPMRPCFEKCAKDILGAQTQITKCFFDQDPKRHIPGVDCVRNDATCYVKKSKKSKSKSKSKRSQRDVFWNDDIDDDAIFDEDDYDQTSHQRSERAVASKMTYEQVIQEVVTDLFLKNKLLQYRQCKIGCHISFHSTNKKKLFAQSNQRFGRSILDGVEDLAYRRERRQSQSDDAYFTMYLGKCYKKSNCKSSTKVADKCMALFFGQMDPKKVCLCMKQYLGNKVSNCDRYNAYTTGNNAAPGRAAQMKLPTQNFMNMNMGKSGFSAAGNAGGSSFSMSG